MAKTFDLSVIFKAVDKFSAPMKKVGKAISRTVHPIKTVGRSLKQLAKDPSMKNLRKQAWYMSTSFKMSAERIKKDLKGVGAQFDRLRKDAGEFGKKMKSVGQDLSLKVTAPITLMGGLATKAAIDFETAFTGVRKTVDATEEEFGALRKQLMGMALEIPLSTTEIFGIAEAAGQLGIKQQDIGGFTKVMADLGATTNLSANEAASSLAKFANITKMSQKDMERLGSTIVDLGNNTATTEADIVAMAMRLAGAGNTVGLTEAQILSLSASLSSVGIEAEAGGTAFSQVMKRIDKEAGTGSQKMKDFATVSGKSVEDFEKSWKENAGLAILDVVEGLANLQKEGANVNVILDELGFEGIRMSDALLRASGAGDKFRKTMELGDKAWEENTALTKEAALRYSTAASKLKIAKERTVQLAASFGAIFVPVILKVIKVLEPVIDWLAKLSPVTKKWIGVIGLLVAVIGPLLAGLGLMVIAIGAITAPIAIAVGAFAAFGIAAGALIIYWKPVKDFFTDLFGFINEQIQATIAAFVNLLPDWAKKKLGLGFAIEVPDAVKMRKEIQEERNKIAKSEAGGNVYFGRETKGREQSLAKINELEGRLRETGARRLVQSVGKQDKSQTDINIKLTADPGTSATIEKVKKKKGDAIVSVASEAFLGAQ